MLPNIGWGELLIILAIALLLFGAKRLPELAQSLGKSIRAFKKSMQEPEEESHSDKEPDHKNDPQ
ncbi:MAG: hypothetical protein A3G41_03185 [Elusimicrobia bacterium RIFCSPLOWO2_12_FULL_59_9]|nr:MAG: hypothetical protein A3G41_03185 [Elusimicrobia bacterium RIFCSPLOWO2_12_FULL_59_9]